MQVTQETIAILDTTSGHAVVVPDSLSGWRMIEGGFLCDRSLALIRAAGVDKARILPAVLERQEVTAPGRGPAMRLVVLVDWQVAEITSRPNDRWYAVRVAPGFQRMAAKRHDAPEHRIGESIVERNLRDAGIDVYMPAFWNEARIRRSRRIRQRRYPLFVGYAFINHDPRKGFKSIEKIDGVSEVLTAYRDGPPTEFRESDLRAIMVEMFNDYLQYRYARFVRIEEERAKQTARLSSSLGRMLKGRTRTVSVREHAQACMDRLAPTVRKNVQGIVALLDRLQDDDGVDEFREPVYITRQGRLFDLPHASRWA